MAQIDVGVLAGEVAKAMGSTLAAYGSDAASYAKTEGEKIAVSIRQIIELYAGGKIDAEEARLKLDLQKNTTRIVLLSVEGIGIIAAEQAINAGLSVIRGAVNSAIGFALL
jgi:hypothetical protein